MVIPQDVGVRRRSAQIELCSFVVHGRDVTFWLIDQVTPEQLLQMS
jgi:hypothetical protein